MKCMIVYLLSYSDRRAIQALIANLKQQIETLQEMDDDDHAEEEQEDDADDDEE